jgi:hypothetical protein
MALPEIVNREQWLEARKPDLLGDNPTFSD